jgi:glycosyltransferase involved in cell wall biosynthesis
MLAGVVADSGQLYNRSKMSDSVDRYFNSGVMLMNLDEMRAQNTSNELVKFKLEECSGNLVDQDAFNHVFNRKVRYLPVEYNCLCVNIDRARKKINIDDFNLLYDSKYNSLDQVIDSAKIIHFASKDKPWLFSDVICADQWYSVYSLLNLNEMQANASITASVIIPVYNIEAYLNTCLDSVLSSFEDDFEVILIDDGSFDRSSAIIDARSRRDKRVVYLRQDNAGQSAARNRGLEIARGEYVYFLDGDDLLKPGAIKELYKYARKKDIDILYFDGEGFFENSELEKIFGFYKTYYQRKMIETDVVSGSEMLIKQDKMASFKPSPCLQFFRRNFLMANDLRFLEGVIYEDNLFSMQVALAAQRCAYIKEAWFLRRVREDSTITQEKAKRHYESYIKIGASILREFQTHALDCELQDFVFGQIKGMLNSAIDVYIDLNEADKKDTSFDQLAEENIFHNIITSSVKKVKATLNASTANARLADPVASLSYYKRKMYRLVLEAEASLADGHYKIARRKFRDALNIYDIPEVRRRLPSTNKFKVVRWSSFSKPITPEIMIVCLTRAN